MTLPALVTFTKYGDEELRYPKIKNKMKAKKSYNRTNYF